MPKLSRYLKRTEKAPIEYIDHPKEQERIKLAVKAIEGYVMFSCIAMGLLQMISLTFSSQIPVTEFRYLRTPSKEMVSEATVMYYLRKSIFRFMAQRPDLAITRFILMKQKKPEAFNELQAS